MTNFKNELPDKKIIGHLLPLEPLLTTQHDDVLLASPLVVTTLPPLGATDAKSVQMPVSITTKSEGDP